MGLPAPRAVAPAWGSGGILEAQLLQEGQTKAKVGGAGAPRPSFLLERLVHKGLRAQKTFNLRAKFLFPKGSRLCCLGRSGARGPRIRGYLASGRGT